MAKSSGEQNKSPLLIILVVVIVVAVAAIVMMRGRTKQVAQDEASVTAPVDPKSLIAPPPSDATGGATGPPPMPEGVLTPVPGGTETAPGTGAPDPMAPPQLPGPG